MAAREDQVPRPRGKVHEGDDRFPSLQDEQGGHLPADVEFGFRNGRLTLLQIRPFVESKSAQKSGYLSQLDARFAQRGQARVDLNGVPKEME